MYDPKALGDMQFSELHQRRAEILTEIQKYPKSWNDPNVPTELLQELAFIAGVLRRKTSGPPRAAKPAKRGTVQKSTAADLARLIS